MSLARPLGASRLSLSGFGALASAFAALALWFALHPYRGVVHDGRLYAALALYGLDPARYASDLFFRYGSQDGLSAFPFLYRPLVSALGVGAAHHIVAIAGQAAWLAGLWALVRALFSDRREALFAAVAAIALQPGYGGHGVFNYGESFATSRPFAEALVMVALAQLARRRIFAAYGALALAGALHPLMALTGAAALVCRAAMNDRRHIMFAGAAVAAALVLAALSIPPFARLFETFDPAWFDIVRQRCSFGFLARWTVGDYISLAVIGAAGAAVIRRGDPALRALALACALASVLACALAAIGGDFAQDVLVVNAQVWRTLWLSRLMANIGFGVLALRAPEGSLSRALALLVFALSALSPFGLSHPFLSDLVLLEALIVLFVERRAQKPLTGWLRWLLLILPCVLAGVLFAVVASVKVLLPNLASGAGLLLVAAAVAAILLARDRGRLPDAVAAAAAGIALLIALPLNDQRTEWQRFLEEPGASADLADFVGDAPNVYWEDNPDFLWIKLGRPSYYSCLQGSGVMFYRATALEYARRGQALARLNSRDFGDDDSGICGARAVPKQQGPQSLDDIRAACRAAPELDAIILGSAPPPGSAPEHWTAPAERLYIDGLMPAKISRITDFYKYKCGDYR